MSISGAMFAGVSGLTTIGSSLAVIGDNIANVNTIGFKSSRSTFETMLAENITGASGTSQVGRGVAMSAVDEVFIQGSFETTGEPTDMAIGGDGFFMVRSPETGMYYTRAGHFKFNEDGYLVKEKNLTLKDLYTADEVFTCGTGEEINSLVEVDGRVIGNGKAGPIVKKAIKLYKKYIKENAVPIY